MNFMSNRICSISKSRIKESQDMQGVVISNMILKLNCSRGKVKCL